MAMVELCSANQQSLGALRTDIGNYLRAVVGDMRLRAPNQSVALPTSAVPTEIFRILTSQRYGYLGRRKSEPYRSIVEAHLAQHVASAQPLHFYFDLGPGYHAGISRLNRSLGFEVSLSELLALRQIVLFANEVRSVYFPGVHFFVVIDNLCGFYTNDIPLECSSRYVEDFRRLIRNVGAEDLVSLIVESELFSCEEYEAVLGSVEVQKPIGIVPDEVVDNVARFLGRDCTQREAALRIEQYRRTGITTETLMATRINGVRLTQRASPTTLGFRAFPGGDQRTQAGRLALTRNGNGNGKLRPTLITSRNSENYELLELNTYDLLPDPLHSVLYADPWAWRGREYVNSVK